MRYHLAARNLRAFLRIDGRPVGDLVALALAPKLVHHADLARARHRHERARPQWIDRRVLWKRQGANDYMGLRLARNKREPEDDENPGYFQWLRTMSPADGPRV